jgi:hypothetical protein
MKKNELKDALIAAIGEIPNDSLRRRVLHVTTTRSAYGNPSTIVFEFAGTPSKFPILVTGLQSHSVDYPTIYMDGRKVTTGTTRYCRLTAVVQSYLDDLPRAGVIDFVTQNCVEHDALDRIVDGKM